MARTVLMLGRNPSALTEYEAHALRSRYGTELTFERCDAADAETLQTVCTERQPFALLLLPETDDGRNKDHDAAVALAILSGVARAGITVLALAHDRTNGNTDLGRRLGKLLPVEAPRSPTNFEFDFQ